MKTTEIDRAKLALQGLSQDIPAGTTSLPVGGQNVTVSSLIATLTAYVTAAETEASAKVAYHQAVEDVAQQSPAVRELLTNLGITLRAIFGRGSPVLAKFGVLPGKPGKASAEAKAAAVQKRNAKLQAKKAALSAQPAPAPLAGNPANGK